MSKQLATAIERLRSSSGTIDTDDYISIEDLGIGNSLQHARAEDEADETEKLNLSTDDDFESQSSESNSQTQISSILQNSQMHHQSIETRQLYAQTATLQQQVAELSIYKGSENERVTPWPVLHRVHCQKANRPATYIDTPIWVRDDDDHHHLDGCRRISDETEWESRQEETPFVVFLEYFCKDNVNDLPLKRGQRRSQQAHDWSKDSNDRGQQDDGFSAARPFSEEVHILSDCLRAAVMELLESDPELSTYCPTEFDEDGRLRSPYIFHYHFPQAFREASSESIFYARNCIEEFQLLQKYLKTQTEPIEREADNLFSQGVVTPQYLPYLFPSGGLLVKDSADGLIVVQQNAAMPLENPRTSSPWTEPWRQLSISATKIEF